MTAAAGLEREQDFLLARNEALLQPFGLRHPDLPERAVRDPAMIAVHDNAFVRATEESVSACTGGNEKCNRKRRNAGTHNFCGYYRGARIITICRPSDIGSISTFAMVVVSSFSFCNSL
jgi:hypothetical protein